MMLGIVMTVLNLGFNILLIRGFGPIPSFGTAGAYEKLRGRAFFALDPEAAANAAIADLKLAPRRADGRIVFTADFLMRRGYCCGSGCRHCPYPIAPEPASTYIGG